MICKMIVLTGGPLNCFCLMSKQYFIASCSPCSVVVLDVFPYAARTKVVCVEKLVGSWLQPVRVAESFFRCALSCLSAW